MKTIGITGSIAMGKSTVTGIIQAQFGGIIFNADTVVHQLYQQPNVIALIQRYFPQAIKKGALDRPLLAQQVYGDASKLQLLQSLLHPLVQVQRNTLICHGKRTRQLVLLDIPLLFNTDAHQKCDHIIVANAPKWVQLKRLRKRGLTPQRIQSILANQTPNHLQCLQAGSTINTARTMHNMRQEIGVKMHAVLTSH